VAASVEACERSKLKTPTIPAPKVVTPIIKARLSKEFWRSFFETSTLRILIFDLEE
jgi:hypothetical protein